MSRILIETNRGKVFGTKNQVEKKRTRTKEERDEARKQAAFANACPAYGLPPEFYRIGLMHNGGFYYLTALLGTDAEITSLMGITTIMSFEDAMNGIKDECEKELDELPTMMELLYDSISECKVKASVRQDIMNRMDCADKAIGIYNVKMPELLTNMNLPEKAFRAGWKTSGKNTHVYEFVSYRPENGSDKPFVLEDICKPSTEPNRFKHVSYENLKRGLLTYAAEIAKEADTPEDIAEATKMYYTLERMCEPSVEEYVVDTSPASKKNLKGQLTLDYYC